MASEMLFALECHDCDEKENVLCGNKNVDVEPQLVLDNCLTRRPPIWQGIKETSFQRTVRELFVKLQNVSGLRPDGNTISTRSAGAVKELCLALRLQGLNARMLLPVSSGVSSGCGRQSTGGGGQCAASGGRRCFFCSRQPYAVVYMDCTAALPWQRRQQDLGGPVVSELLASTGCGEVLLVDPCLGELFRVAPSTTEYTVIVEQLPQVWVGPRAALLELADALCDAMAVNFRSQGLDVPPWRRRDAVMSRWDPNNQREVELEIEPLGLLGTSYRYSCRVDHNLQHFQTTTTLHEGRLCKCAPGKLVPVLYDLRPALHYSGRAHAGAADSHLCQTQEDSASPAAASPVVTAATAAGPSSMPMCSKRMALFTQPGPSGAQNQSQFHRYFPPEVVPAGRSDQKKAMGRDPVPPVVVYGFNLQGPARAV